LAPSLLEAGATEPGLFVTEASDNTFPALPVRTGEHVVVSFTRFDSAQDHESHGRRLAAMPHAVDIADELSAWTISPPTTLRLTPTTKSRLC
jgi:hypothetical protein